MKDVMLWFQSLWNGLVELSSWFITPIDLGIGFSVAPITFCTFGVLMIFLGVAIVKWIIS